MHLQVKTAQRAEVLLAVHTSLLRYLLFSASMVAIVATAPAQALQEFTYSVTTKSANSKDFKDPSGIHKPGVTEGKTELKKLRLAPTWFSFGTDDKYNVYDNRKKQVLVVDAKKKSYKKYSMYELVNFFISECQNRKMLNKLLTTVKPASGTPTDFEIDSYFSVTMPGREPEKISEAKSGDATSFQHGGKTACTVTWSKNAIDVNNADCYRRFIAYSCHLYPVIVQSLADDKFAFASLHVSGKGGIVNSELQTTDMTLTQARTIPGDDTYSLGGYTLDRSEVLRPVRDALAKFGPNPKLPTKDEVSSLVIAETKEGRALDAFLAVCEQTWMTNDDMLENIKRLKMPLSLDSNCGAVMAAMSQPKKEQMDDVEKLLAKIDRSKLKHSEAIDVLLANDFAGVGSPQRGQELMIKALTKNPLLVGAYIDLMQIMIMQFQMPAWECAEIARELNPNYSRIKEIDQREQQIQTLFPHYF